MPKLARSVCPPVLPGWWRRQVTTQARKHGCWCHSHSVTRVLWARSFFLGKEMKEVSGETVMAGQGIQRFLNEKVCFMVPGLTSVPRRLCGSGFKVSIPPSFKWSQCVAWHPRLLLALGFCVFLKLLAHCLPISWPPNFLNSRKSVHCVHRHICGVLAPALASNVSKPENRWDQAIAGKYGLHPPWQKALTCCGFSGGCRHHPCFQKWSVTLIHCTKQSPWLKASQDPKLQKTWKCQQGTSARMPWPRAHPG